MTTKKEQSDKMMRELLNDRACTYKGRDIAKINEGGNLEMLLFDKECLPWDAAVCLAKWILELDK